MPKERRQTEARRLSAKASKHTGRDSVGLAARNDMMISTAPTSLMHIISALTHHHTLVGHDAHAKGAASDAQLAGNAEHEYAEPVVSCDEHTPGERKQSAYVMR